MIAGKTLEQTLTEWILDEKLSVSKRENDKTEFHLMIPNVYGLQFGVEITKPKGASAILIGLALGIAPQHKQAFSLLNEKEKSQFLFEIRTELLRFGVDFTFMPNVQDQQYLNITYVLYVEELSRPSFMKAVRTVRNATLYFMWSYGNKFSNEVGNQPPSGYG